MDNELILQQFEEIEQKVEKIIAQCISLENTNSELRNKIGILENNLEEKDQAEKEYFKEKDLVRAKIDDLLVKLNGFDEDKN